MRATPWYWGWGPLLVSVHYSGVVFIDMASRHIHTGRWEGEACLTSCAHHLCSHPIGRNLVERSFFFLFWLLRGLWSSWARDQIRATARSELLQWRCQALNPLHLHRQGILSVACRFFSSLSRDCYAGPVYPFVVIFKEKFWNLCFLNPRVRLYFWLDQGLRWKEEEGRCVLVDSVNKRWRLIGKEFTVWISS